MTPRSKTAKGEASKAAKAKVKAAAKPQKASGAKKPRPAGSKGAGARKAASGGASKAVAGRKAAEARKGAAAAKRPESSRDGGSQKAKQPKRGASKPAPTKSAVKAKRPAKPAAGVKAKRPAATKAPAGAKAGRPARAETTKKPPRPKAGAPARTPAAKPRPAAAPTEKAARPAPGGDRAGKKRPEAKTGAKPARAATPVKAEARKGPARPPTKQPSRPPTKQPSRRPTKQPARPQATPPPAKPVRLAAPADGAAASKAKAAAPPKAEPVQAPVERPPQPMPVRQPPPPPVVITWVKPVAAPPEKGDLQYPVLRRGKVREVYQLDRSELLIVTSDRVSAFDVVLNEPIPRKGEVLTLLTAWWLARLETKGVEHHLISVHPDQIIERHPDLAKTRRQWERRAMLVRKTDPIPVECVVRGYLAGSAWREYLEKKMLAGERLPEEMQEGQRLPRPFFAPATKATEGHDINITPADVRHNLGEQLATRLERLALRIYDHGRRGCEGSGIILADTKFEFGLDLDGRLLLIDEVMTPDSSRFWPKQSYAPGKTQTSLDKQPIRDWLDAMPEWDKKPPPPTLPPSVVSATTERYLEIFRRLTGTSLDDFQPPLMRSSIP